MQSLLSYIRIFIVLLCKSEFKFSYWRRMITKEIKFINWREKLRAKMVRACDFLHGCMATSTSWINKNKLCLRPSINQNHLKFQNVSASNFWTWITQKLQIEFLWIIDLYYSHVCSLLHDKNMTFLFHINGDISKKLSLTWKWQEKLNSPPLFLLAAIYTQTLAFKIVFKFLYKFTCSTVMDFPGFSLNKTEVFHILLIFGGYC